MTKRRSPEEQARLDARLKESLCALDEERERRRRQAAEFVTPRFRRAAVAAALDADPETLKHWHLRGIIVLDGADEHAPGSWNLYSARDVLRLAVVRQLSAFGYPPALVPAILEQLAPVLEPSPFNLVFAANVPASVAILPDGRVLGPFLGEAVDPAAVPAGAFVLVRLDHLIRTSLERLGFSIVHGNADAHRAAAERIAAAPLPEVL